MCEKNVDIMEGSTSSSCGGGGMKGLISDGEEEVGFFEGGRKRESDSRHR